jgi:hypothetical protein
VGERRTEEGGQSAWGRRRGWKKRWIIFGWYGFMEKCGFVDTLDLQNLDYLTKI